MRRRERRLQELIRVAPDAVIFTDPRTRIVRFNPAAERMFGYSADEILGQDCGVLIPEPAIGRGEEASAGLRDHVAGLTVGDTHSAVARRKGGEDFPVELTWVELQSDDEVRYAAFIRDVSERMRLQHDAVELSRLSAVGLAASMFAHEVSNPLNNLSLHFQALQERLRRRDGDEVSIGHVRTIAGEIRRLVELLSEFRALYRRPQRQLEVVRIGLVLRQVLATYTRTARATKVAIRREVARRLPPVRGDADRLKQVFVNLLKNAIEAMPAGGTLTVRATAGDGVVVVEFQDTGVGVAPGLDVFEPFKTTKRHGTGLGLAIVKQIVEDHQGSIDFVSEVAVGTTFRLTLPARPEESRPA